MKLSFVDASRIIRDALIGSNLDEIRSLSTQVTLRFLGGSGRSNALNYIDVVYCCESVVANGDMCSAAGDDFFFRRGEFLRDVFQLMGVSVNDAIVASGGELSVVMSNGSIINIFPSADDFDEDGWIWRAGFGDLYLSFSLESGKPSFFIRKESVS